MFKKINKIERGNGFTLIEVLIAIAVFSIGTLTIISLQISSIRTNLSSRGSTEAASWAVDRMEKLMTLPFDDSDIDDGTHQAQSSDSRYDIDWTVIDNDLDQDGDIDIKIIEVIVSWIDFGVQKRRTYNLIKANNL